MIRLLVHGSNGRVGARVRALADTDARFDPVDPPAADRLCQGVGDFDALIDFTTDDGAKEAAGIAASRGAALVVGTTGLSPRTLDGIRDAARLVPVIVASNTSIGMAAMRHLVTEAGRVLGAAFDVDIVERHRAGKRDAPSGTAIDLAASLHVPLSRVHPIRAGDVVGEHVVEFSAAGERLQIRHQATDRDVFARGALEAAAWLAGRAPGAYGIDEVIGIGAVCSPSG